ncbi:MAG: hypothetical protein JJT96_05015 [Opitutales bacterium]|nr:hypothetical protein [Opitutales bacterium]
MPGTFPEVLQIYGYTFDFTFYGQAFRDNSPLPELAYTEGAVRFQEAMPVGALLIELEKITFDCFGNLLGASIPGGSADKQLKYWNADITLHSITFRPGSVPCKRFLVAATSAYSTLIDTALSGDLGIFASGHLINRAGSQTAGIEPVVTSRFHLPGSIELAGSTAENPYTFTPLVHAYFNDFAQAGAQPASGWLNFAGDLGVAFFKAPFVHVHTSARRQFDADSDLVVARSLEPAFPEYDPTNRGFPVDADVSAAAYRGDSGSLPERWRLGVNRRWSGFIDFQYPVSWHRVLRSFRSPEPLGIDVKIFTLTTELTHLDAYSAKMEFATGLDATYLANPFKGLAFLVPDSWLNEAFFNNFGLPASFLNNGHRAIGELLGDRVDPLLTEILDSPGMSAQVASAANLIAVQQWGADTSEDWHGDLRAALATQLKGAESLRGILESLGGPGSTEVPSLVGLTRDRLNALRMAAVVMSEGVFQPHAGGSWTPEKPPGGIFHQVGLLPLDENGEVDFIASRLTGMLHDGLKALSGEAGIDADIAEFFGSLEELNNKLKLMLKVRGPAFKKLTEIFKKLGGDVKKLIEELDSGESALSAEILRIVAESDMNALAEEIADAIAERLRELSGGDALDFADIPPEKLAEVVRRGISDGLASAAFMGEFQLVQRQRLYDWNLKLQQASDTVFAESNKITRILVAEILQKATGSLLEQIPYYDTVANFDDIAAARVSGHAHVYGDSMRLLRFDASGKFGFLKPIEFEGFFEVRQLSSKPAGLCTPDPAADEGIGEALQEIIFGATVSSAKGFLTDSKGTLITAGLKLSHDLDATASWIPRAFAGHFSMEGLKITDVMDNVAIEKASAVIGVGRQNSYLGLATAFKYRKWKVAGGVFFGLTCSTEPIKMIDKKVGEILAEPSGLLFGAYGYFEGWFPISEAATGVPAGCWFNISGGMGAGAFFFADLPIDSNPEHTETNFNFGGKMFFGGKIDALCIFTAKAEATLTAAYTGGGFRFDGLGKVSHRLGVCRYFCVRHEFSFGLRYLDGDWSVKFPYKK